MSGAVVALSDEPLQNMRERVAKCRWLATQIADGKASQVLLEMADDIERDIEKLEAERLGRANPEKASSPTENEVPTIIIGPE